MWDDFGRFFVLYGVNKGPGIYGKAKAQSNIKIYSIFGEPILTIDKLVDIQQFQFRPRPKDILNKKELTKLKKEARKLYRDKYVTEESKEREIVETEVNAKKKAIRDEFLDDFWLPLRRKYEQNIDKYMELWPLKEEQLAEED